MDYRFIYERHKAFRKHNRRKSWGLRLGKGFLDLTTMAQSITKKMGKSPKLIFLFCFAKTPFKRMKS